MIRRFLTRILMVALLAFCGYNWLQVRSLQAQMTALRGQLQSRLAAPLPQAGKRTSPARSATGRTDWDTGRRDWTALQAQAKQVREEADALWRETHSQTNRLSR